jgi:DNA replication and repair protein RecF
MYLTHLSLTNFRNFARLDTEVPRGSLVLVGENAQGKTSLLEAIYFLATLTSFHASQDRQLINFIAAREPISVARLVAAYLRGGHPHRMEVRLIQEANGYNNATQFRKEVLLDGVKLRIHEAVGHFNAVLFLPQMVRIIDGAPEERRRFLNLALSQVVPRYGETLSNYTQALSQRNALLKQLGKFGGDASQLEFWDEQLSLHGAELIHARIQAIKELERQAAKSHKQLTRGGGILRFSYQPAFDPLPRPVGQYSLPIEAGVDRSGLTLEQIRLGLGRGLVAQHSEDIARGLTTLGPHRDELRFLENGIDLGVYGSRGQVRTAILALKLAEATWMQNRTGHLPVLLFDEALAELDPQRRGDLLAHLAQSDQSLLTTTDLDLFAPEFIARSTLWQISGGRLDIRQDLASPGAGVNQSD